MNIGATLYGQFIIIFALIMGVLCYSVARGKMKKPKVAGFLGAVLSLVPLLSVGYFLLLLFKKNQVQHGGCK